MENYPAKTRLSSHSENTFWNVKMSQDILIVSKHVVESISKFISDLLDLQLLPVDLVLDVVNPLVELGDVHLSVIKPALGHFVLVLDAEDLLLQFLFSLHGLLSA